MMTQRAKIMPYPLTKIRGRTAALLTFLLLSGCQAIIPAPVAEPSPIESIADAYVDALLERYPSMATAYDLPGWRHDRLFDNSQASLKRWHDQEDAFLDAVRALPAPSAIGARDWITYGFLIEALSSSQSTRICQKALWETSTTTAWYTGLPFIFDIQPIATETERLDALTRLSAVAGYIETEIENLRAGLAQGYASPRLTVVAVPDQVRALLQPDNPFLNLGKRSDDPLFQEAVQRTYDQSIQPALNLFADFIETEYLPNARTALAISNNPNGAQCYTALVRAFSTLSVTPAEIHRAGLAEMASIQAEMRDIIDTHFEGEATATFLRRINRDPAFTFETEQAVLDFSMQLWPARSLKWRRYSIYCLKQTFSLNPIQTSPPVAAVNTIPHQKMARGRGSITSLSASPSCAPKRPSSQPSIMKPIRGIICRALLPWS